jgi:hypothetical protein
MEVNRKRIEAAIELKRASKVMMLWASKVRLFVWRDSIGLGNQQNTTYEFPALR